MQYLLGENYLSVLYFNVTIKPLYSIDVLSYTTVEDTYIYTVTVRLYDTVPVVLILTILCGGFKYFNFLRNVLT